MKSEASVRPDDLLRSITEGNSDHESWLDKARREAGLIKEGASGFKDAFEQSTSKKELPKTMVELGVAAAAGVTLAYLTRGQGLIKLAAETLEIAGTAAAAKDGLVHGKETAVAMDDAWHSPKNWNEDAAVMRKSVGRFAFDTTLASAGGLTGSIAGHFAFKPEIPPRFFDQFDYKTGIRHDYYNAFNPAEFKTNVVLDNGKKMPAKIVENARTSLPEQLGKVRTYTKYWEDEIALHESTNNTKLDATGIKNFFVNSRPRARKLDGVAADIRNFADKDLGDPNVLNQLVDKFQTSRRLIYGNDPHQARRLIFGPDAQPGEFQSKLERLAASFHPFRHA